MWLLCNSEGVYKLKFGQIRVYHQIFFIIFSPSLSRELGLGFVYRFHPVECLSDFVVRIICKLLTILASYEWKLFDVLDCVVWCIWFLYMVSEL